MATKLQTALDLTIYTVMVTPKHGGSYFRELPLEVATDRAAIKKWICEWQFDDLDRVFAFNPVERSSSEVSAELADEIYGDLLASQTRPGAHLANWIERHAQIDVQEAA